MWDVYISPQLHPYNQVSPYSIEIEIMQSIQEKSN